MTVQEKLEIMGITLPVPAPPIANYLPFVKTGQLLFISGQLAFGPDGKIDDLHTGKLGTEIPVRVGQAAARLCVINVLAQARAALGDLEKISCCIRLGGFINAAPGFTNLTQVMNGASDFMVEVFGDRGRHARTTTGVAELPLNSAVEVEALFEIAPA